MTEEQKGYIATTLNYILERLKEPSTLVAIGTFVALFGVSDETWTRVTANAPAIISAVAILTATFLPSRGSKALREGREERARVAEASTSAGDGLL